MLVRNQDIDGSSRARNQDKGRGLDMSREMKLGIDRSMGRHQARGTDGNLARRRFNQRGEGGGGRTRAGRQEKAAAPVFSNFEAFNILNSTYLHPSLKSLSKPDMSSCLFIPEMSFLQLTHFTRAGTQSHKAKIIIKCVVMSTLVLMWQAGICQ